MKIDVGFTQEWLFGKDAPELCDVPNSIKNFIYQVGYFISTRWPHAEVEVKEDEKGYVLIGDTEDSTIVDAVTKMVQGVYDDREWVTCKSEPIPPDPLAQAKMFCADAIGRDYMGAISASNLAIANATIALVEELRQIRKYGLDVKQVNYNE